jgi:ATP-dependent Clp protease ATP-binding subunit ClpC
MFERFTEQARQVVVLAQDEARALKHNYIGTEHLLLGLIREEAGVAAQVLGSLDLTLERVRGQIVRIVGSGEEVNVGQVPFTPRGKKVLEVSLREALSLGHNYIGTEHILLGLVRDHNGVAARILLDFDADSDKIREEVIRLLPGPSGPRRRAVGGATGWGEGRRAIDLRWLDGLGPLLDRLAADIREHLGRDPDPGDLLVVLASAQETLSARAVRELGVDVDALWGAIVRIRTQLSAAHEELGRQIQEVCRAKEEAIEAQEFQSAARLREQERELRQRARAYPARQAEALREIRRRLGIAASRDDAPRPPDGQ